MKNYNDELMKDGMILKRVPKKIQTIEMCRIAIYQNPKAFRFASQRCIDYEMCLSAVKLYTSNFRYVPDKFITEEMSKIAVIEDSKLLNKVPEKYRTNEMYRKAIEDDVSTLEYVPEEKIVNIFTDDISEDLIDRIISYEESWLQYMPVSTNLIDLCINYMKSDFTISQYMPSEVKSNRRILEFQKSLNKIKVTDKYYNAEEKLFCVRIEVIYEEVPSTYDEIIEYTYTTIGKFSSFYEFYSFLDGDLFGARLRDYDFNGVNIKNYSIEGAVIHSNVLFKQGLYNGEYYNSLKSKINSKENNEVINDQVSINSDFHYLRPIEDEEVDKYDFSTIPFFYISDIHIAHRVINKFKDKATKEEVELYIRELVERMVNSIGTKLFNSYILIAGDTSSMFELSKVFYDELAKRWEPERIIVISGNHELWDPYIDLEKNISEYRSYFNKKGITYLQNDFLYIGDRGRKGIIKESDLLEKSVDDIRAAVQQCSVSILGGIGFSGLNKKYNAINMRYGKSFEGVSTEEALKKDFQQSDRFNYIYEKLLRIIPKDKVIVLTHMKKDDWNKGEYNRNWIYLNGHTHHNFFEVSDEKNIYADNQIGYRNQNIGLKHFYINNEYDTFTYLEDGIHKITSEQYSEFYIGKRVNMSFKRQDGTIYIIKKNNNYMFLIYCYYCKSSKQEHLYLMNGGKLCKLEKNRLEDLNYYFDYLDEYTDNIHQLLYRYTGAQERVSEFVKYLGGSGKIHGCIVDVEKPDEWNSYSYCHLFVNPVDGKVTPYFAYDIKDRTIYKDIKAMLESNKCCKLLEENYLRLEQGEQSNLPVIQYSKYIAEWGDEQYMYDEGSYLYNVSRIIKGLQYCTEKNIVRIWNEKLLNYNFVNKIKKANSIESMINDGLVIEMN